jgi:hypothetical protein
MPPPQCLFLLHARKGHLAQERGHYTRILLVPRHTRCTDRKLRSGPFQRTIGHPERRGIRVSVPCTPELRSFLRKGYLVPQHIQFAARDISFTTKLFALRRRSLYISRTSTKSVWLLQSQLLTLYECRMRVECEYRSAFFQQNLRPGGPRREKRF